MNDVRTGEKVVRVPLGETAIAAYGYPYGVIYRADLHQVFLDACRAMPNVDAAHRQQGRVVRAGWLERAGPAGRRRSRCEATR